MQWPPTPRLGQNGIYPYGLELAALITSVTLIPISRQKIASSLIKEIIENRTHEEINNNKNGKNYIELVLADNSEVIEFTPKHLGDIKSTLDN